MQISRNNSSLEAPKTEGGDTDAALSLRNLGSAVCYTNYAFTWSSATTVAAEHARTQSRPTGNWSQWNLDN